MNKLTVNASFPVAAQVKDLARKYPDIAEVCVGSVSNISLEVSLMPCHLACLTALSPYLTDLILVSPRPRFNISA